MKIYKETTQNSRKLSDSKPITQSLFYDLVKVERSPVTSLQELDQSDILRRKGIPLTENGMDFSDRRRVDNVKFDYYTLKDHRLSFEDLPTLQADNKDEGRNGTTEQFVNSSHRQVYRVNLDFKKPRNDVHSKFDNLKDSYDLANAHIRNTHVKTTGHDVNTLSRQFAMDLRDSEGKNDNNPRDIRKSFEESKRDSIATDNRGLLVGGLTKSYNQSDFKTSEPYNILNLKDSITLTKDRYIKAEDSSSQQVYKSSNQNSVGHSQFRTEALRDSSNTYSSNTHHTVNFKDIKNNLVRRGSPYVRIRPEHESYNNDKFVEQPRHAAPFLNHTNNIYGSQLRSMRLSAEESDYYLAYGHMRGTTPQKHNQDTISIDNSLVTSKTFTSPVKVIDQNTQRATHCRKAQPKKSAMKKTKNSFGKKKVTFAEHHNKHHEVSKWVGNCENIDHSPIESKIYETYKTGQVAQVIHRHLPSSFVYDGPKNTVMQQHNVVAAPQPVNHTSYTNVSRPFEPNEWAPRIKIQDSSYAFKYSMYLY